MADDHAEGWLSMVDIAARTELIANPSPPASGIAVLLDDSGTTRPFSPGYVGTMG
jgi:hypothetical protein